MCVIKIWNKFIDCVFCEFLKFVKWSERDFEFSKIIEVSLSQILRNWTCDSRLITPEKPSKSLGRFKLIDHTSNLLINKKFLSHERNKTYLVWFFNLLILLLLQKHICRWHMEQITWQNTKQESKESMEKLNPVRRRFPGIHSHKNWKAEDLRKCKNVVKLKLFS